MKNLFGEFVPVDFDSLESDFWRTPEDLYPEGCFDPCPVNPTFDGLSVPWNGMVFCNPPYSQIPFWIDKAIKESTSHQVDSITMLLPNWTDRKWFQDIKHYPIVFLQGRVRFLHPKSGKPMYQPRFGSMLVTIK